MLSGGWLKKIVRGSPKLPCTGCGWPNGFSGHGYAPAPGASVAAASRVPISFLTPLLGCHVERLRLVRGGAGSLFATGYAVPMPEFKTAAAYVPTGDQPQAIAQLATSIDAGERYQTLLGATGTGKTATMAWLVEQVQKP